MRFVPVNFGQARESVSKPHERDALALAPSSGAILLAQIVQIPDLPANGNGFNMSYFAEEFKFHGR
jgi:hypothetical protein